MDAESVEVAAHHEGSCCRAIAVVLDVHSTDGRRLVHRVTLAQPLARPTWGRFVCEQGRSRHRHCKVTLPTSNLVSRSCVGVKTKTRSKRPRRR